jgi:hypothetical protein
MTQVYRNPIVPIFGSDVGDSVTIVVRRIVNQYIDAAEFIENLREAFLQFVDLGEIAIFETRRVGGTGRQSVNELQTLISGDVDKDHLGALAHKGFDECLANPRTAAGDEDAPIREAWIDRRLCG